MAFIIGVSIIVVVAIICLFLVLKPTCNYIRPKPHRHHTHHQIEQQQGDSAMRLACLRKQQRKKSTRSSKPWK